jgi:zinc protease
MKMQKIAVSILILLLSAVTTQLFGGNQDTSDDVVPAYTPPAKKAPVPVKLPPVAQKILKNGLKVIVVEQNELPVLSMRLQCNEGSFSDPPGKAGLTRFMTGLLTQGTQKYGASQIAEKIDFVGGNIDAGSDWDACYVSITVLSKYADTAVELLREVALHPAFAQEEIERLRAQSLSSIKSNRDDPASLASEEFNRWLYGDYPYAFPIEGSEESVGSFTREDVVRQYQALFIPNNSVFAIIGDVKAGEAFKIAEKIFGEWKRGERTAAVHSLPKPPQGYSVRIVDKPDATQTQIRFGHFGVPRSTEDYFPLVVMNYILGGGGFSSRMMKHIRSELGLTYGINSSFAMRRSAGPFVVGTYTKNESTLQAIQETIRLMREFREQGPTAQELEEAKSYLTGSYPLNFETPGQIASQLLNIELYGLGADYIEKYRSRIEAVTADDVLRVARKYLDPDNMIFVVVSKPDDVRSGLESLGPLEIVEIPAE